MKIVIALGGNALAKGKQNGTYQELAGNIASACGEILRVVDQGHQLVIAHGNGPQVGNLAVQQESTDEVPSLPLHVLDAMTQGEVGYLIQRELGNRLRALGSKRPVVSVVSQVLVDQSDPAFSSPSKPIGPFYSKAESESRAKRDGLTFRKVGDGPKPYRRVVPSPDPKGIVEADVISRLLSSSCIVVAGGGGGIPVARGADGRLVGVDAVVDKDLCAERIAESIRADMLLILTDVKKVKVDYRTQAEKDIDVVTVAEAKRLLEMGQFPPGSMGPKILACIRFVEWGGKPATIASLQEAAEALNGSAGTKVVP